MTTFTTTLNELIANFVKARDADGTHAGADEAYALAEFCADIFEKPFYVGTDDGERSARVPHKSSQDAYRETWRKEGHAVRIHTLTMLVVERHNGWFGGAKQS